MKKILRIFMQKLENRLILLFSILVLTSVVFCLYGIIKGWDEAFSDVFLGFIVNVFATVFSLGVGADLLQKRLESASRRNAFGPFIDFWMAGKESHFKIFIEVYFKDGRRSVNFDTMSALAELTSTLTQIHGDALEYEVIDAKILPSYSDLKNLDCNVILLGGDKSIPLTIEILRYHNSRYKQDCSVLPGRLVRLAENQEHLMNYESTIISDEQSQKFVKEYALVTRIPVNRGRYCWYLISGNHGVGTYLASLAISEPQKCPVPPPITERPIQIMLIGENITRSSLPDRDIEITCQRGWEHLA